MTMRKSKKDQKISDVLSDHGFAFEFFKAIAHAVMSKGGTMRHMRRVVKESTLQEALGDLIVPVGSVTEIPLSENEFLVPVSYTPLPSFSKLEHEFGQGNVSNIFDGRPFQKHSSCVNIDETSGNKIFLVKHFGRETESEDNIAEMDKLGYRPATQIEAHAFQKKNPDLQCQFYIVALGSFAVGGGGRFVAVLGSRSGRRVFGNDWFDDGWDAGGRFLFVRK